MAPLLDPLRGLVSALAGLGLLPAVFKPLPGVIDTVAGIINSIGAPILGPLGIQFAATGGDSACTFPVYTAPPVPDPTFAPFDQQTASLYRYRQQQSVNLGGWFVHEPWMTPSLYSCAARNKTSELDLASGWGNVDTARQVLEHHWDTFITDADFAYLSSIGINTVRIPIGYWTLGPDFLGSTAFAPVAAAYANSWPRLARAINQAADHGIGVLVDLHGAPGSQNGLPSSGISDGVAGLIGNATNEAALMTVLSYLTQQLAGVSNVVGIELLNEPTPMNGLTAFYDKSLTALRAISSQAAAFPFYLHDSYQLAPTTEYVSSRQDWVVVDDHSYFVSANGSASRSSTNQAAARPAFGAGLKKASATLARNVVVGEWSCALPNNTLAAMDDAITGRQQFCRDQLNAYANLTSGWAFWSYNMEQCDASGWCFKALVGNVLPSSFSAYPQGRNATSAASLVSSLASIALPGSDLKLARSPADGNGSGYRVGLERRRRHGKQRAPEKHGRPHGPSRSRSRAHARAFASADAVFIQNHSLRKILRARQAGGNTSEAKGYSDGFNTAKMFAQTNASRLGFVGQYVNDSFAMLVQQGSLDDGDRVDYRRQFQQGLQDGEAAVMAALAGNDDSAAPASFADLSGTAPSNGTGGDAANNAENDGEPDGDDADDMAPDASNNSTYSDASPDAPTPTNSTGPSGDNSPIQENGSEASGSRDGDSTWTVPTSAGWHPAPMFVQAPASSTASTFSTSSAAGSSPSSSPYSREPTATSSPARSGAAAVSSTPARLRRTVRMRRRLP